MLRCVLVAMVMRAANNAFSGEYASYLFSGDDAVLQGWIQALLWCLIAAATIALTGRSFRTPPRPQGLTTPDATRGEVTQRTADRR